MSNNNVEEDCEEGICEATEGLIAFCEAITDDGKRKRCVGIMDLLKEGKMDTDTAREKLTEELGKDGYTEGAKGLREWIASKEELQIEEPAPIKDVELPSVPPVEPIIVDIPTEPPVSIEIPSVEPIAEEVSEPMPESEVLPEAEKVSEVKPEPPEAPSYDDEQPQSEQSEE